MRTDENELLFFSVCGRIRAVRLLRIDEIFHIPENGAAKVPLSHPALYGITQLRGKMIPVVDIGSSDIGSSDIGSSDIGSSDIGSSNIGSSDIVDAVGSDNIAATYGTAGTTSKDGTTGTAGKDGKDGKDGTAGGYGYALLFSFRGKPAAIAADAILTSETADSAAPDSEADLIDPDRIFAEVFAEEAT